MTTIINGSSPSITFSDSTTQTTAGLPLTGGTLSGALTVPTLNAPSGVLATQNGMTGIAKAWVNFTGQSPYTINNSFNVSSITFISTGQYYINFTNAMPNANYVTTGSVVGSGVANNPTIYLRSDYSTTQASIVTNTANDVTNRNFASVQVLVVGS